MTMMMVLMMVMVMMMNMMMIILIIAILTHYFPYLISFGLSQLAIELTISHAGSAQVGFFLKNNYLILFLSICF